MHDKATEEILLLFAVEERPASVFPFSEPL
jgi:hypothetical protein